MGYQESFIFAKNKTDLIKLAKVLNKNFDEMSDFVLTTMACRFKKPINMAWPVETELYKKGYFLYWVGERHPIQNNHWLEEKLDETSYVFTSAPLVVPCENIREVEEVFEDWKEREKENFFSDDLVDIYRIDVSKEINIESLKNL